MNNLIFICLISSFLAFPVLSSAETVVPDFRQYKDIKKKKTAFFAFLLPYIKQSNLEIQKKRADLLQIAPSELDKQQKSLIAMARYYRVDYKNQSLARVHSDLLKKIDVIPPSLALAQAANESAWGTSRFAREASNYFGQWCLSKGCGLVPRQRQVGKVHEVRKFNSAYESVKSYIHHLNAQPSYTMLREIRYQKGLLNQSVSGLDLVVGLEKYSARKQAYITELAKMIRVNKLAQYDL